MEYTNIQEKKKNNKKKKYLSLFYSINAKFYMIRLFPQQCFDKVFGTGK
jgi:hypothetical protein